MGRKITIFVMELEREKNDSVGKKGALVNSFWAGRSVMEGLR